MVGLVVASHGHLAQELVVTATQIMGELTQVATCSVEPGSSPDDIRSQLRGAIQQVEAGDGVLVFADLIGGSVCTQSLSLCQQARVEVLTGVNLPMFLKATTLRSQALTLTEFAHQLASYGQRNITVASEVLRSQLARAQH